MTSVENSIRLNDYMTRVMQGIIRTMNMMISHMEKLDSQSKIVGRDAFAAMRQEVTAASVSLDMLEAQLLQASQAQERAAGSAGTWGMKLMGVWSLAQMIRGALQSLMGVMLESDEYVLAGARLDLINDGLRTQAELQRQVLQTANATRSSYTATAALVARMGRAEMFRGDNDTATRFADIINKSLVISGAGTAEASSVITQLSQAMSSGVLRGEEFNAIMENGSRLADALSAQLGVNRGQLRAMAQDGLLTADIVAQAILEQGAAIDEEFRRMPVTFGQSVEVMKNTLGFWLQDMADEGGPLGRVNAMFARFVAWLQSDSGSRFLEQVATGLNLTVGLLELAVDGTIDLINWFDSLGAVGDAVFYGALALGIIYVTRLLVTMGNTALASAGKAIAGFATAHPYLFAIGVAIGIAIAVLKHFGVTTTDVVVWALSQWYQFLNEINAIFLMVNQEFHDIGVTIDDFVYHMLLSLEDGVNGAIKLLNAFAGKLNDIFGTSFGTVKEVTFATRLKAEMDANNHQRQLWIQNGWERLAGKQTQQEQNLLDVRRKMDAFFGQDGSRGAGRRLDNTGLPNLPDYISKVGEIGKISGDVDLADESMKYLVDLATQKYVNNINLTVRTDAPNITQHNTVRTEADFGQLVGSIIDDLNQRREVSVEQAYS